MGLGGCVGRGRAAGFDAVTFAEPMTRYTLPVPLPTTEGLLTVGAPITAARGTPAGCPDAAPVARSSKIPTVALEFIRIKTGQAVVAAQPALFSAGISSRSR